MNGAYLGAATLWTVVEVGLEHLMSARDVKQGRPSWRAVPALEYF